MQKPNSKALITGINGFVGSHLAEHLLKHGYDVSGITLPGNISNLSEIEGSISLYYGDIRDADVIQRLLEQIQPDNIYHLAGSAFVPDAQAKPKFVFEVNALGTLTLLEAARSLKLSAKILIVGSGDVYGSVPQDVLPVKESYPLHPSGLYGMTKVCADQIAQQYAHSYHMHVVRARPFNHIGPRQSEQFVCSSFAKQIVEIENGIRDPLLLVGNLQAYRDFTDVRDIVRAYRLLLEKATAGSVYNIGSNKAVKIQDLVKKLVSLSHIDSIEFQADPKRLRSNDNQISYCDSSLIRNNLGWTPEIPLDQTLRDLLEYWRQKLIVECEVTN